MSETILIVDDEPEMLSAMARVLERKGYDVDRAADGEQAISRLSATDYDAMITDLRMPRLDGRELLRRVRKLRPTLPVIVVTAFGSVASAVGCVRGGAVDYLVKPFDPEALEGALSRALDSRGRGERDTDLVADDPATVRAVDLACRAAASEAIVLLEAESGAGKEVFARLIHDASPRARGPFVAVNCAALPKELLESELFGHTRGAFTGAIRDRKGHFRLADGGTLFLDEIGEMTPELQSRMLRVLQDRMVRPVGADASFRVDVRVIAATNRNLRHEVAEGRFREDLYYRLRVFPVRIPPLRERTGDVAPLARRFAARFGGPDATITEAALRRLAEHGWPGNVRELENAIQRAAVLAAGRPIDVEHVDLEPALRPASAGTSPRNLEQAERDAIRAALADAGGNRTLAARALGISPRTLRHKLKRYRDSGIPVIEAER